MKAFLSIFFAVILSAFLSACSKSSKPNKPKDDSGIRTQAESWQKDFPARWWQSVPRDQAQAWEILPQDAGFKEVILSKRNELGILSNFAETPFVFHGVCYPTIEAFWQMMKYPESREDIRWSWTQTWKYTRQQVSQMNGFSAKYAGSFANSLMDKNTANWVTFEGRQIQFYKKTPGEHHDLIVEALLEKIRQNPNVLELLLKTKDLTLRPDHHVDENSPREWHYNLLWMDIRSGIQNGTISKETSEDISLRTCKAKSYPTRN